MKTSVSTLYRILEEWWQTIQQRGIPGAMLRDQLPGSALPPTGNTGSGYTPDPDAVTRVQVRKNSTGSTYERRRVNLIEGSNVTLTVADDSGNEEVDVTIAAASSGVSDGDKGDITVSSSGTVWTIDNDVVTYAKMQNVSATDKLLGRATAGSGDVEEIALTAAGRALIDDAAASNQRTTLGLGTIATQDASSVSITGGSVTGITDLTLADGGTGASLTDPNADRILFWDDSAGAVTWLTPGTGLTITTTTIDATASGSTLTVEEVDASPTDSAVTKLIFPNGTLSITSHEATYTPSAAASALTVEEVDASPTDSAITKIVFPNGTLSITSHVATYTPTAVTYPTVATIWHDTATIITGNVLTKSPDASQPYCAYAWQNAPANGDIFEHTFFMASGTYTMEVLGLTANSRGIIDWTIDGGAAITGQDWYSAGLTYNVRKTGSVTISTSGAHTLRGTINGKNASSSTYQMLLTRISLK